MKNYSKEQLGAIKQVFNGLKEMRKSNTTYEAPEEFTEIILDHIKASSRIYQLVRNINIDFSQGGRLIIGSEATPAEFKKEGEPAAAGGFDVELDFRFSNGYSLIKVLFISNDMLESEDKEKWLSQIVLAIGDALALGLDDAILNGGGKDAEQPEGIITNIPEANKVTVTAPTTLYEILSPIKLVDSGKLNQNEIVVVVNRNTYYSKLFEFLLNCNNPDVLPKFIISYAMPEDQILFADLSKYTVIQRGKVSFAKSRHFRFLGDETGFKGRTNFDGTPTRKEAFALVTLA